MFSVWFSPKIQFSENIFRYFYFYFSGKIHTYIHYITIHLEDTFIQSNLQYKYIYILCKISFSLITKQKTSHPDVNCENNVCCK